MDPITQAITAVLPALASDLAKSGAKDAYEGLKAVIRRKWGEASPIDKAIAGIEEDPSSKAQKVNLHEKVEAVAALKEPDVLRALHRLVEQMKTNGIGGESGPKMQNTVAGDNFGMAIGIVEADNVFIRNRPNDEN